MRQLSGPITFAAVRVAHSVVTFLGRCKSGYDVGHGVGYAGTHRVHIGYGIGLKQNYKLALSPELTLVKKGPCETHSNDL